MAKKNKTPWTEIKTKYLLGETPLAIYNEYSKFLKSPKQISDKAYKDKWKNDKAIINEEIDEIIKDKVKKSEISRNQQILEINDLALAAFKEYLENKDYKRTLAKTKEPYRDKDGNIVYTPKGQPIMVETVTVIDIPFVDAMVLKQATEGLARVNETSRKNEGILTKFDEEKLSIEREKLELDKQKLLKPEEEETESDNFIEALSGTLEETWADYEPTE